MAQTGKNKLRRWEHPAGSGIRIREIINRNAGNDGGLSYRVTIPARTAGLRQFKQFTDIEKAEAWAKEQHDGAKKDGQKHFTLSPTQREDAVNALALLDGTGLSLSQAVALAKKHLQSASGKVTVQDAIKRLVTEKEAENLRERSVRDLKNRLDIFGQTFGDKLVADVTQAEVTSSATLSSPCL